MRCSWKFFVGLVAVLGASTAYSYQLRCNKKQNYCEIITKRLTVGDHVGIFDPDGNLSAVGTVMEIEREVRKLKITRRFNRIQANHDAVLIQDDEASNPEAFFKVLRLSHDDAFGFSVGLYDIGVGSDTSAFAFDGYKEWPFMQRGLSVLFRGNLMTGKGKASDTGEFRRVEKISFLGYSGLAGFRYLLRHELDVSVRFEGALGAGYISGKADGPVGFREVVNGRLFPGWGLAGRLDASLYFRIGEYRPFAGVVVYKLQNSLNYGLQAGLQF